VDRAPFSDVRFRRAVHLALDRPALVESVLNRRGAPAGQFVSPAVFGYAPEIRPPARDLPASRRLLAEAGFPRGVDLTLEHASNVVPHAAAIAAQLADAGIRLKTVAWPWATLYQRLNAGESDFFVIGFACDTGDATDVMDIVLHSRDPGAGYGAHNFSRYVNTSFDLVLDQSGEVSTVDARLRLLRDAMRIGVEDLPLVPLWTPEIAYGFRKELVWQPRLDQKLHAYAMRREARGGRR
jgi:peptide/nickel transport system substrate-binding protein